MGLKNDIYCMLQNTPFLPTATDPSLPAGVAEAFGLAAVEEEEEEEEGVATALLFTAVTVGGCESAVWCARR